MEQNTEMSGRPTQISPLVWFLGIGLVLALTAIFVFNVAVGTVTYYGFIALFIGSHFFMHSGHGRHGGPVSNAAESDKSNPNQHSGHSGGCH